MSSDVDRTVFETPSVTVGAFRCPVEHPSFADSGPIRNPCFVFPRTPVVIQHKDSRPFAADPTVVTLYNRGQEYRRRPLSPDGDRCDWYSVSDALLRDALRDTDPRAADDTSCPIRFRFARSDARTYLVQRELFVYLSHAPAPDRLYVEETVVHLLDCVLSDAYRDKAGVARTAPTAPSAAEALAYDAREFIGRRFCDPLTLDDIARAIDSSPFHLCRSFRRATGTTLHDYRNQLRLRSALDRLETAADLSSLALDLGYSSHSHFTAAFRRAFGVTPSAARRRIARTAATS